MRIRNLAVLRGRRVAVDHDHRDARRSRPKRQPAVDGSQPFARRARGPGAGADEPGGETAARLRLFRHRLPVQALHRPRRGAPGLGRLRSRNPAARHSAAMADRRRHRRRHPGRRAREAGDDRPSLRHRHRRELGSRRRLSRRRDDRIGSAILGLQRHAGRRGQSFTRAAQRPQLRIWRRGSAAGREHRRRPCRRHPVQRHHLDDQAFRAQRPGDRPRLAQRGDRRRPGAHVRPARLPDRDRAGRSRDRSCAPTTRSTAPMPARIPGCSTRCFAATGTGPAMSCPTGARPTAPSQAANVGLDQDSGFPFDEQPYFGEPLRQAIARGQVLAARLDEMAKRILRSMFAHGLVDHPVEVGPIDFAAHAAVTPRRRGARRGAAQEPRPDPAARSRGPADRGHRLAMPIAACFRAADRARSIRPAAMPCRAWRRPAGPGRWSIIRPRRCARSRRRRRTRRSPSMTAATREAAARLAAESDVALVFVNQWTSESIDTSLTLPGQPGRPGRGGGARQSADRRRAARPADRC